MNRSDEPIHWAMNPRIFAAECDPDLSPKYATTQPRGVTCGACRAVLAKELWARLCAVQRSVDDAYDLAHDLWCSESGTDDGIAEQVKTAMVAVETARKGLRQQALEEFEETLA